MGVIGIGVLKLNGFGSRSGIGAFNQSVCSGILIPSCVSAKSASFTWLFVSRGKLSTMNARSSP